MMMMMMMMMIYLQKQQHVSNNHTSSYNQGPSVWHYHRLSLMGLCHCLNDDDDENDDNDVDDENDDDNDNDNNDDNDNDSDDDSDDDDEPGMIIATLSLLPSANKCDDDDVIDLLHIGNRYPLLDCNNNSNRTNNNIYHILVSYVMR
jgi:hypothetical protein